MENIGEKNKFPICSVWKLYVCCSAAKWVWNSESAPMQRCLFVETFLSPAPIQVLPVLKLFANSIIRTGAQSAHPPPLQIQASKSSCFCSEDLPRKSTTSSWAESKKMRPDVKRDVPGKLKNLVRQSPNEALRSLEGPTSHKQNLNFAATLLDCCCKFCWVASLPFSLFLHQHRHLYRTRLAKLFSPHQMWVLSFVQRMKLLFPKHQDSCEGLASNRMS